MQQQNLMFKKKHSPSHLSLKPDAAFRKQYASTVSIRIEYKVNRLLGLS